MELKVSISPDTAARLGQMAEAAGVTPESYAAQLIERLSAPPRSMLELSGPVYEEFVTSGMTDDELGELLEREKHAMRAERRRRTAS